MKFEVPATSVECTYGVAPRPPRSRLSGLRALRLAPHKIHTKRKILRFAGPSCCVVCSFTLMRCVAPAGAAARGAPVSGAAAGVGCGVGEPTYARTEYGVYFVTLIPLIYLNSNRKLTRIHVTACAHRAETAV